MRDGAIMANSGHFDAELDLAALRALAEGHVREVRENVQEFDLGGKRVNLIAEGRLVNLGAAEGHPAAVMDMSFANQALSAEYALHHAELEPRVYVVPEAIDAEVARLKLAALDRARADDARAGRLRRLLAARHLRVRRFSRPVARVAVATDARQISSPPKDSVGRRAPFRGRYAAAVPPVARDLTRRSIRSPARATAVTTSPRVHARENFQCCSASGIDRWSMKPGDQPREASGPAK